MTWIAVAVGFLGFLIHWLGKAREKHGTLKDLGLFLSENALNLLYGLVCYGALMLVWWAYGLELLGMVKGEFTGMTFFVGYFSSSIVGTWVSSGKPTGIG